MLVGWVQACAVIQWHRRLVNGTTSSCCTWIRFHQQNTLQSRCHFGARKSQGGADARHVIVFGWGEEEEEHRGARDEVGRDQPEKETSLAIRL
jgi:hypothetical protein